MYLLPADSVRMPRWGVIYVIRTGGVVSMGALRKIALRFPDDETIQREVDATYAVVHDFRRDVTIHRTGNPEGIANDGSTVPPFGGRAR